MASLIPGYEYDIFISYRQKDNKYDGWVTEFVDNLKKELEATFKEEISVYFDINPSDYLLETYDVDASLKDKLKCLVFIPIISRTYCDPKSFAWVYEFKAFVEQASKDNYGLKIKLPNGNVASRILPIQIHELKAEDKMLFEKELGGLIRAIEFIYKEAGVNRPLTPKDSEDKNINRTNYRNQINKVANAIDEIISSMKVEPYRIVKEKDQGKESFKEVREEEQKVEKEKPTETIKVKFLIPLAILALLIITGIIAYPKIFRRDTLEKLRASGEAVSVAVMPFQNMTNDTVWNIWQNGIQNELINNLTNSKELQVRQSESVTGLIQSRGITNTASLTPSVASEISKKLNASVFVHGSIKQVGNTIRVNAQLIDSNTEDIFKSFQIDGTEDRILHITDSLSAMIRDFLIITVLEKEIIKDFRPLISTNSSEAYKYYMFGNQAFYKEDHPTADEWYKKAVDIDSTFSEAIRMLIYSLGHQGLGEESNKWVLKNYQKRNQMPEQGRLWAEIQYAQWFGTPDEVIKYFKLLVALDDEMPVPHSNLAGVYREMGLYDKAILELEKHSEIYKKWGIKERWSNTPIGIGLGKLYHLTGQYKKEKKLYNEIKKDYPDNPDLHFRQAVLAFSEGKTKKANEYIDKYISASKKKSVSEAQMALNLAWIYDEADIPDKAEEYYRKASTLEPENLARIQDVAFFLIDNDRNIKEGLDIVDRVLKSDPDNYSFLECKGWGLYKEGRYNEALDILQKSWELRGSYNHDAFLHLEEVRKAVAEQNK